MGVFMYLPGVDDAVVDAVKGTLDSFADRENVDGGAVIYATSIAAAVLLTSAQPEIRLDVDGAITFNVPSAIWDGRLLFAELYPDGALSATVYDAENRPCMTFDRPVDLLAWLMP